MGQKINPLGFRLGTTQSHHSLWFAQPKNYSEGLQEDQKIRDFIKNYVQKNKKERISLFFVPSLDRRERQVKVYYSPSINIQILMPNTP